MLPALGQLITLTTDVTLDQDYEIAILDSDGSRASAKEGTLPDHFKCRAHT